MNTNNNKTTGEKLFFNTLFALAGGFIVFTVSTMFIPYEKYEALLNLIF
jgi:zinc transporter ZupT